MNRSRTKYSAGYSEYQKTYHKKWLENPETRAKWNTYQRARTSKNAMAREIAGFFKGKVDSKIQYDEETGSYLVSCFFKKLSTVPKTVFTRSMAAKGYTVNFGDVVTVAMNLEVPQ